MNTLKRYWRYLRGWDVYVLPSSPNSNIFLKITDDQKDVMVETIGELLDDGWTSWHPGD